MVHFTEEMANLRRQAVIEAICGPAPVMFLALVSFGVIAKTTGFELELMIACTAFLWALPAQIALAEAVLTGTDLLAIALIIGLINLRFLPMVASLIAELKQEKKITAKDLVCAHVITPATWTWCSNRFQSMPVSHRQTYLLYLGGAVWAFGILGSIVGFILTDYINSNTQLVLIFIAPVYMLLQLVQVADYRLLAVGAGGVSGYATLQYSETLYLFVGAAVGGGVGFLRWRLSFQP